MVKQETIAMKKEHPDMARKKRKSQAGSEKKAEPQTAFPVGVHKAYSALLGKTIIGARDHEDGSGKYFQIVCNDGTMITAAARCGGGNGEWHTWTSVEVKGPDGTLITILDE